MRHLFAAAGMAATLSIFSAFWTPVAAQQATLNVRIGGDDFRGTDVRVDRVDPPAPPGSMGPVGPAGPFDNPAAQSGVSSAEASDGRTVDFGGNSGRPLEPGIHNVTIRKGDGVLDQATTYVFVGPGQSATIELSLAGVPNEGIIPIWQRGQEAKRLCQLKVYDDAIVKLRLWEAYYEAQARDMAKAIRDYIDSSLLDSVPRGDKLRLNDLANTAAATDYLQSGNVIDPQINIAKAGSGPKARQHLDALGTAMHLLSIINGGLRLVRTRIEELRPRPDCPKRTAMLQETLKPISVGAKDSVGCTAKLREDVVGQVGGALGGMFGMRSSPLGGGGGRLSPFGGGGGGGGSDLEAEPDPVKKEDKQTYTSADGTVKTSLGAAFTDKGLWISANVLDAPCKGTFQTIYLQDPLTGQKAGPTEYRITELYLDWKLTVSWTRDTYVDGKHVKHESGGWSDSGRELMGRWTVPGEGEGIWKNLGFSTAVAGVRGVAAFFPIPKEHFARQPLDVVVHVSRPDVDPVLTQPFGFETYVPQVPVAPQTVGSLPQGPLAGIGVGGHAPLTPEQAERLGAAPGMAPPAALQDRPRLIPF